MKTLIPCAFVLMITLAVGCHRPQLVTPIEPQRIELTYEHDGQRYYVADDGNLYRDIGSPEAWELVMRIFDPDEVKRSYVFDAGKTYRIAPDTQQRFEVQQELAESFEDLQQVGLLSRRR